MKARYPKLDETYFECLSCNRITELDMTIEEYFQKRKGKRAIRTIELDGEGYSRKWQGIFQAHDGTIIRDDGRGHPHIACPECGKVNVFGKDERLREGTIKQVLGRSETDLRFLRMKERDDGEDRAGEGVRMGGEAGPTETGVAGYLRAGGDQEPA